MIGKIKLFYSILFYSTSMPVKAISLPTFGINNKMENKSVTVRRCLFGKPDREEIRRDLDAMLKNTATPDMASTWNFDSVLDTPTNGRYEWSLVSSQEYVPSFYRKGYPARPSKSRGITSRLLDLQNDRINMKSSLTITPPSSPECVLADISRLEDADTAESAEDMRRDNETTPENRPVRQSRIEDFMKCKKRRLSDDSSDDERPAKRQAH